MTLEESLLLAKLSKQKNKAVGRSSSIPEANQDDSHLTKTPSIELSPQSEATRRELSELIKNNSEYSDYFEKLQGDSNIKSLRNQLKQIQES